MTDKKTIVFGMTILLSLTYPLNVHADTKDRQSQKQSKNKSERKTKTKKISKYAYVGNTFSKKYHLPGCEFAQKINVYHVKLIRNKDEAKKLTCKACNWCMPRWTKSVSSKVIK